MIVTDIGMAKTELDEREQIALPDISRYVGYWSSESSGEWRVINTIGRWATLVSLD
jgi:hypothetical protein